jgi:ATP-dependent Clp protease ATP-binding subunit ClpX
MGFNADVAVKDNVKLDQVSPDDIVKFGMIPEFVGRFPSWVSLDELDKESLIKILTEVKHNYVSQYKWLFDIDDVKLEFRAEGLSMIAERAIKNKTGARGLHTELERVLLPHMYQLKKYKDNNINVIDIDAELVKTPKTLVGA